MPRAFTKIATGDLPIRVDDGWASLPPRWLQPITTGRSYRGMTKTKTLAEHLEAMPDKLTHQEALEAFKDAVKEVIKERSGVTNSEVKEAMKSAFKELLDERAQKFGYASFKYIWLVIAGGLFTLFSIKYGIKSPF